MGSDVFDQLLETVDRFVRERLRPHEAEVAMIERLYRDARMFRIYEGTMQIQQYVIA